MIESIKSISENDSRALTRIRNRALISPSLVVFDIQP
jgi:hypothetical protein